MSAAKVQSKIAIMANCGSNQAVCGYHSIRQNHGKEISALLRSIRHGNHCVCPRGNNQVSRDIEKTNVAVSSEPKRQTKKESLMLIV